MTDIMKQTKEKYARAVRIPLEQQLAEMKKKYEALAKEFCYSSIACEGCPARVKGRYPAKFECVDTFISGKVKP